MAKAEVNINKFTKDTTMTVKINVTKELKIRVVIASVLIRAAARVLGCNIEIKTSEAH